MKHTSFLIAALLLFCALGADEGKVSIPKVGDTAKDFALDDLGGNKVELQKLVKEGPVVLVVLRGYPGYQCPFCTKQFAEFLSKADELKAANAQVVFVYPGPADELKKHAEEFVGNQSIPDHFHLVIDPDYTFTNTYGLRWDAKGETAYPSTFVVDRDQKIVYAKVSKGHGDRTKVTDVVKSLSKIREH